MACTTARVVPGGGFRPSDNWLRFSKVTEMSPRISGYRVAAAVPGVIELPGQGASISLELIENRDSRDSVYNEEVACLDWQRLSGPLEVRNWRPGDIYQPAGSAAPIKLKSLFQEARIPVWERRGWPLLTAAGSIVWTRRFGAAAGAAARPGSGPMLQVREIGNRDRAASVYSGRGGLEVS